MREDDAEAVRWYRLAARPGSRPRPVQPPTRGTRTRGGDWTAFELRDRTGEGQHYRVAGLGLLAATIIYWNTLKLGDAVFARRKAGSASPAEFLGPRLAARLGAHQPDR